MRYTPFSYQERYGLRLQRLALDGGFSCPNRDGKAGTGGCTFCDNRGERRHLDHLDDHFHDFR